MIYCAIIAFFLCFVFIFYISRHSWATAARNHDVPIAVISAGMGHSSERTTLIYLDSLDNAVIDNANEKILKDLNDTVSI